MMSGSIEVDDDKNRAILVPFVLVKLEQNVKQERGIKTVINIYILL